MAYGTNGTQVIRIDNKDVRSQVSANKSFMLGGSSFPIIEPHPYAHNPVLTSADVTDRVATGVADPFYCYENGKHHMFFEVISSGYEEIGHAESVDGLDWTYTGVVISEGTQHFAYPHVFKYNGKWYMIPDKGNTVDVYEATTFPTTWINIKTLFAAGVDGTLFSYKDNWYMHVKEGNVVNLYVTDDWLNGTWSLHPSSPILNQATDRGAGRPVIYDDCVILPMQGYVTRYGEYAQWYKLYNLSPTTVTVYQGNRFVGPQKNNEWNASGMHHIDMGDNPLYNDIMVVDGINSEWSIGIYTPGTKQNIRAKVAYTGGDLLVPRATWTEIDFSGPQYDTDYIFDDTYTIATVPQNGYYRVKAQATEYGTTTYRNIRLRIYDKTNAKELVRGNNTISSTQSGAHPTSVACDTTLYLKKGTQVSVQFYTLGDPSYILPGGENIFFEIEKIG